MFPFFWDHSACLSVPAHVRGLIHCSRVVSRVCRLLLVGFRLNKETRRRWVARRTMADDKEWKGRHFQHLHDFSFIPRSAPSTRPSYHPCRCPIHVDFSLFLSLEKNNVFSSFVMCFSAEKFFSLLCSLAWFSWNFRTFSSSFSRHWMRQATVKSSSWAGFRRSASLSAKNKDEQNETFSVNHSHHRLLLNAVKTVNMSWIRLYEDFSPSSSHQHQWVHEIV